MAARLLPLLVGVVGPGWHEEALRTMAQYKVRRLPVIDGHDLVGIISVADIARELEDDDASKGDLIQAISEALS